MGFSSLQILWRINSCLVCVCVCMIYVCLYIHVCIYTYTKPTCAPVFPTASRLLALWLPAPQIGICQVFFVACTCTLLFLWWNRVCLARIRRLVEMITIVIMLPVMILVSETWNISHLLTYFHAIPLDNYGAIITVLRPIQLSNWNLSRGYTRTCQPPRRYIELSHIWQLHNSALP